jgi:hypothetical protein
MHVTHSLKSAQQAYPARGTALRAAQHSSAQRMDQRESAGFGLGHQQSWYRPVSAHMRYYQGTLHMPCRTETAAGQCADSPKGAPITTQPNPTHLHGTQCTLLVPLSPRSDSSPLSRSSGGLVLYCTGLLLLLGPPSTPGKPFVVSQHLQDNETTSSFNHF